MTRIDFYVLASADPQSRRIMACRLTEKAWRMGMKVFLRTADDTEGKLLDNLLWTFRQGSFIPHALSSACAEDRQAVTVLVGPRSDGELSPDLLVNLATDIPEDLAELTRLAEVIDEDEEIRSLGRSRYRRYKELGHAPQTHQLDAKGGPGAQNSGTP